MDSYIPNYQSTWDPYGGILQGATGGAQDAWTAMKAASVASGRDFFRPGGTLSTFPSPSSSSGTMSNASTNPTTNNMAVGLDSGPTSLRAATNSLQSSGGLPSSGGGGGSSGSGSSGGGGGGGMGGLLAGAGAPSQQQPYNSPNFSSYGMSGMQPMSYQSPQQGYISPNGQTTPSGAPGMLNMQNNPQAAMQNYLNTPGYQLLGDPSMQRFQHSPGYQYAVDEAMNQVQRGAASRGLLESGRVMRDMTDRAQGMAQQDYGNWWNRQNQLYGDYQNRLAGLAGGDTGANQAYNMGQTLGAGGLQTGADIGTLFGNQGNSGLSGIMNTGAAQSNNMQTAGNMQAQINSANQSTRLAGATAGVF